MRQRQTTPPWADLTGSVGAFLPLDVALVKDRKQRQIFKDLVGRHHYLGYAMPFGARLQYLIAEVKTVMVYPLLKHAARRLREAHGG